MIPRILHYVWVGSAPLPETHRRYIELWKEFHPDYAIRRWTDADAGPESDFVKIAMAHRCYSNAANFLRLEALANHGGIYMDTDVQVVRALDPLLSERFFVGCQGHPVDFVNGAIIGSEPNHPVVMEALDELIKHGKPQVLGVNGPMVLTKVLRRRGLRSDTGEIQRMKDATAYPYEYFYPYSWNETPFDARLTPNTYTIHHWTLSWTKPGASEGIMPTNKPQLHPNASLGQVLRVLPWLALKAADSRLRKARKLFKRG